MAAAEVAGRPVIVATEESGSISMWSLDTRKRLGKRARAHGGCNVTALAIGYLAGEPVVISAGEDDSIRPWRLDGFTPLVDPLSTDKGRVDALAVGYHAGRPAIVSAHWPGTVIVRRLDGRVEAAIEVDSAITGLALVPPDMIVISTAGGLLAIRIATQ